MQWAKGTVLQKKQLLFLLYLRDPRVKSITNVPSLVKHFCQADSLTKVITDWLIETNGEHLAIILDGYDEISEADKCHFIHKDIIRRNKLGNCALVITSRPAASACLHNITNCRAEILGFTRENRKSFIKDALQKKPDKIEQLDEILKSNPVVDLLCYIPLNMSMLLCLVDKGTNEFFNLNNLANLYEKFVIMTITRSITKTKGITPVNISNIDNLPHPYNAVIKKLAKFAFLALKKDQLMFSLSEIQTVFSDVTPANCNSYGYGLIKQTRYFTDVCAFELYYFLHFSIQEYLAACHIASLPYFTLLNLLKKTFWDIRYLNTWMMYVGITGGQQFVFNHFLSGNVIPRPIVPSISRNIQQDKIKCLYLNQCLAETEHCLLSTIQNMFQNGILDVSHHPLSLQDLHTLVSLLIRSRNKQWEKLTLSNCSINEEHCKILWENGWAHNADSELNVRMVDISHNKIQWESLIKICDLLKHWHSKEIVISSNNLLDTTTSCLKREFEKKLMQYFLGRDSQEAQLYLVYVAEQCKLIVVCLLFHEKETYWCTCSILCYQLTECKLNDELIAKLGKMNLNPTKCELYYITNQNSAEITSTLSRIFTRITFSGFCFHSEDVINGLNNSTDTSVDQHGLTQNVNVKTNLQTIDACKIAIYLYDTFKLHMSCPLKELCMSNISINDEAANDVAATVLYGSNNLKYFSLINNNLQTEGMIKITKALQKIRSLIVLEVKCNNIGKETADDIADVISHNAGLHLLNLSHNNLQTEGAIKIAKALQKIRYLQILHMNDNNIGDEAASDIAAVISCNNFLSQLYLSYNALQMNGIKKIVNVLQGKTTLQKFAIGGSKIGNDTVDGIMKILSQGLQLTVIDLSDCNLQPESTMRIVRAVNKKILNLKEFNMGGNSICIEAVDHIKVVLNRNVGLQALCLNNSKLNTMSVIEIARALRTSSLLVLYMGGNDIGDGAAGDIANVLSHNEKLKRLDLNQSNLQTKGVEKIAKALQKISSLQVLDIGGNKIGNGTADEIVSVLHGNPDLQLLDVSNCSLTPENTTRIIKGLKKASSLLVFNIRGNIIDSEVTDNIGVILSQNTKLAVLDLSSSNLQASDAMRVAMIMKNTSSVLGCAMIDGNHSSIFANNLFFDIVQKLQNICGKYVHTWLEKNCLNFTTTSSLFLVTKRHKHNDIILDHSLRPLILSADIQITNLSQNGLQANGTIKIMKIFQPSPSLTFLYIIGKPIDDNLANSIADILIVNPNLQELILCGNGLLASGAITITNALQNTSSLTVLSLRDNGISDEAADNIASVLSQNTKLQQLDISGNTIHSEGAVKIARALLNTTSLVVFNMSNNEIDDEAADTIAAVISCNTTRLQHFDLSGNNIQGQGLAIISMALQNVPVEKVYETDDNVGVDLSADPTFVVLKTYPMDTNCYIRDFV